jgi:hypothetical protein
MKWMLDINLAALAVLVAKAFGWWKRSHGWYARARRLVLPAKAGI